MDFDFEANVTFLTTENGGRKGPVTSGYAPSHRIVDWTLSDGLHEYPEGVWVKPGESSSVRIKLLRPELYPGSLWIGKSFNVQEGGKVVGTGVVTRVLNNTLNKELN
ncbi:EF-Tu C-terminal domain-related protein [Calycomorphotria hydatis]|uniref:Elongation factor Tu n=1 Tax=Calycomorphotria hydatis TaxID=2528027 RepID=A0A517TEQ6_9PLAN|nr:Elongation factor Tu [Calycomorphotria hydatis]